MPIRQRASRLSSTISNVSRSVKGWLDRAHRVESPTAPISPARAISTPPTTAIWSRFPKIYEALPRNWLVSSNTKLYEPAFYATVISDWVPISWRRASWPQGQVPGRSRPSRPQHQYRADRGAADKAKNSRGSISTIRNMATTISIQARSIPFRLFPCLQRTGRRRDAEDAGFRPGLYDRPVAHVTDPIESLIGSAVEIVRAYVQASLIDRAALVAAQGDNDAWLASPDQAGLQYRRFPHPRRSPPAARAAPSTRLQFTAPRATGSKGEGAPGHGCRHGGIV